MYYTYEHWRSDLNTCFYVGKGKENRAYQMKKRTSGHKLVQAAVADAGGDIIVKIVNYFPDEMSALQDEVWRIADWRAKGVTLVNRTNGGMGVSGLVWTKSARAKMANSIRAYWYERLSNGDTSGLDQLRRMAAKNVGAKRSPETCALLREKALENAKKRREAGGYIVSEETRAKLREALKRAHAEGRRPKGLGGWKRPDTSARLAAANRATKGTEQAKERARRAALAGHIKRGHAVTSV
jgi:hypothetical protein